MCELGGGITLYSPSMVSRAGLNLRNVLPELSKETAPVKFIHHVSLKENEQIQFLMAAVEAAIQKLDHE